MDTVLFLVFDRRGSSHENGWKGYNARGVLGGLGASLYV